MLERKLDISPNPAFFSMLCSLDQNFFRLGKVFSEGFSLVKETEGPCIRIEVICKRSKHLFNKNFSFADVVTQL